MPGEHYDHRTQNKANALAALLLAFVSQMMSACNDNGSASGEQRRIEQHESAAPAASPTTRDDALAKVQNSTMLSNVTDRNSKEFMYMVSSNLFDEEPLFAMYDRFQRRTQVHVLFAIWRDGRVVWADRAPYGSNADYRHA